MSLPTTPMPRVTRTAGVRGLTVNSLILICSVTHSSAVALAVAAAGRLAVVGSGGAGGGGFGGGGGGQFGGGQFGGGGGQVGGQVGIGGQGGVGGVGGVGTQPAGSIFTLPEGIDQMVAIDPQNALLVYGTEEGLRELEALIAFLDRPLRQVEIEAQFVQVNTQDVNQFGITFSNISDTDIGNS